ncbi:MAG: hypothetical protein HY673_17270 [Chloroflexi bacterium]|nr:hypothetical protein [Chloroflexota bacterium]
MCELNAYKAGEAEKETTAARAEAERYKAETAAALAHRESDVKALQDEVNNLTEHVQTAGTLPSVHDFLTHCESGECQTHAQEWREVKRDLIRQAIDGMTPEMVQAKAQQMDLVPRRIVIKNIESLFPGR